MFLIFSYIIAVKYLYSVQIIKALMLLDAFCVMWVVKIQINWDY